MADLQTLNKTILPLIRNVMPLLMAQQIVGVQPMTGPLTQIFNLRKLFAIMPRIKMTVYHYQVFLRLNNRKKSQTEEDFAKANYYSQEKFWLPKSEHSERLAWCDDQFGRYGYIQTEFRIWFENENDLIAYKLRWC
jgi:hypothetical protein